MTEQNVLGHAESPLLPDIMLGNGIDAFAQIENNSGPILLFLGGGCEWKVGRLGQKQTKTCCCKKTRCSFQLC